MQVMFGNIGEFIDAAMCKERFKSQRSFFIRGSISLMIPGIMPPQKPQSTCSFPLADPAFLSKAGAVVVTGDEFKGISISVVMPPPAAERVPVANPS